MSIDCIQHAYSLSQLANEYRLWKSYTHLRKGWTTIINISINDTTQYFYILVYIYNCPLFCCCLHSGNVGGRAIRKIYFYLRKTRTVKITGSFIYFRAWLRLCRRRTITRFNCFGTLRRNVNSMVIFSISQRLTRKNLLIVIVIGATEGDVIINNVDRSRWLSITVIVRVKNKTFKLRSHQLCILCK